MRIAIDIGATTTRIGLSKHGYTFSTIRRFPTPASFQDGITAIANTIKSLYATRRQFRIGVAIPGHVDRNGQLGRLSNLPNWSHQPIVAALSSATGGIVHTINDAVAAGIGEAVAGAGKFHRIVAYLTISTGIGGVRVIHGMADAAAHGFEPGHHTLVPNGHICGCGRRGCFETYASGTAFRKIYGVRPETCQDPRIWNRYARWLGEGVFNTIVFWSPDVVVIGGGVALAGRKLFHPLRRFLKQTCTFLPCPPILRSQLGDHAGLYGCLKLLDERQPASL